MPTKTAAIDRELLTDLIESGYGVQVRALTPVPVGECSYAYAAETAAAGDLFVKIHIATSRQDVEKRLKVVSALHYRCGIRELVAPLKAIGGGYTLEHPVGPLALFPHIEGRWLHERSRTDQDRRDLAHFLARLHTADVDLAFAGMTPIKEGFDLPYASTLEEIVEARVPQALGSTAGKVRALLDEHRDDILTTLDAMQLRRSAGLEGEYVVTHGDPTQGNLLRDLDGGLHVVDWDEVALGPPERDLVFFGDTGWEVFWNAYRAAGGPAVCRADALRYYMYRWDLQEVADWGSRLLAGGLSQAEERRSWNEFAMYLPLRHEEIERRVKEMVAGAHHQPGSHHIAAP